MTAKPSHHLRYRGRCAAHRHCRTINQNHRQTQRPSRFQLGGGTTAAGIFGHQMGNAVLQQQRTITLHSERATGDDYLRISQRQIRHRIDQAQQVMVRGALGGRRKQQQVLPADGQKNPRWRGRQCGDGAVYVSNTLPLVAGLRLPSGALEGQQRHARSGAGIYRIAAHLRGKRVGGIDHMGDALRLQPVAQTGHTAKAADAGRQRLSDGRGGATGIRKNSIGAGIGQSARQLAGLGGAAQQQNTGSGASYV